MGFRAAVGAECLLPGLGLAGLRPTADGLVFADRARRLVGADGIRRTNVGGAPIPMVVGAAALHYGWRAGMTIAGCLAILAGLYLCWRLRDRPQAVGVTRRGRLASRCAGNRPAAGRRWDVS